VMPVLSETKKTVRFIGSEGVMQVNAVYIGIW
jgi:hypothetical protein